MTIQEKKWKTAFFILLSIKGILFILFVILILRLFPTAEGELFESQPIHTDESLFTIETDKQRFNQFIGQLLAETESEVPYVIEFGESNLQLRTRFDVMGQEIPLVVYFNPEVEPNGDLLLMVDSFELGLFSLPVDRMLMLLNGTLELEHWIIIYPTEELVDLKVSELPLDENERMSLRFKTLDMEKDHIILGLYYH
ncbi:YpmS family protein [Halalkalibacter sp. AB-rgal2]|uniref:YpmS family protein n=1 Tax=Halalkalibacter sp. AB-rgal2 TaxID=3242695 RepID=UPI00359DFDFC